MGCPTPSRTRRRRMPRSGGASFSSSNGRGGSAASLDSGPKFEPVRSPACTVPVARIPGTLAPAGPSPPGEADLSRSQRVDSNDRIDRRVSPRRGRPAAWQCSARLRCRSALRRIWRGSHRDRGWSIDRDMGEPALKPIREPPGGSPKQLQPEGNSRLRTMKASRKTALARLTPKSFKTR